jgi:hypothetical protein
LFEGNRAGGDLHILQGDHADNDAFLTETKLKFPLKIYFRSIKCSLK